MKEIDIKLGLLEYQTLHMLLQNPKTQCTYKAKFTVKPSWNTTAEVMVIADGNVRVKIKAFGAVNGEWEYKTRTKWFIIPGCIIGFAIDKSLRKQVGTYSKTFLGKTSTCPHSVIASMIKDF